MCPQCSPTRKSLPPGRSNAATNSPRRCEHNERDAAGREVLLVLQVSVGCDQRVEPLLFGCVQQLAIRELRPATFVGRDDLMLRQRATQRFGRPLVEQYAHLGRGKRAAGGVI